MLCAIIGFKPKYNKRVTLSDSELDYSIKSPSNRFYRQNWMAMNGWIKLLIHSVVAE